MTGTTIVISALYATLNVVTNGPIPPLQFPFMLALLIVAAVLTCVASLSLHATPDRKAAKGATLRNVRSLRGPSPRRY